MAAIEIVKYDFGKFTVRDTFFQIFKMDDVNYTTWKRDVIYNIFR